ncbi:hypothetical protein GJV85_00365 [Sulfurimonas aquatica]|uniref:SsuA/THI5-like domain-containing protein n=1 Tax=Sulfurimonas aquatica TaxID=2672570 RepID=A0A975AXY2_9BACT|nr:hypothetical protein [Sulfurimonas aquatica]QSZ40632.1 hypothetical protein GJV85_00365 [Sulfurimonas aquatica]
MKKILIILIAFLFIACEQKEQKPLVLSVDRWIGASPIYYAHKKGWLKDIGIEMILAPSIADNLHLYRLKVSDIVTGTQHEFFKLKKDSLDIKPFLIYDRSYGGDVIMANRTLKEFQNSSQMIHVYLELGTINEEMLNFWKLYNEIADERLILHNATQDEISNQIVRENQEPLLLITYNPHNIALKKSGFYQIADSMDDRYLVLDSLFTSDKVYKERGEDLKNLKTVLLKATMAYEKDAKEYYETIKGYISNPSYEEFKDMQKNIRWLLDSKKSDSIYKAMESMSFPHKDLL